MARSQSQGTKGTKKTPKKSNDTTGAAPQRKGRKDNIQKDAGNNPSKAETVKSRKRQNAIPAGPPLDSGKRKRDGTDAPSRPTLKKVKVEPTTTDLMSPVDVLSTAADKTNGPAVAPQSILPASQFQTATSTSPCSERNNLKGVTLPLPNFEWIEVSHTPERFLARLQLRSFLLLFGHLAPNSLNPRTTKFVQSKVLTNPNRMWTVVEMGKIMQIVLAIVGPGLMDVLKGRNGWHGDNVIKQKKLLLKNLTMHRKGFTDQMWEDCYELLCGVDHRFDNSKKGGGRTGRNRERPTREERDRIRRASAADPAVKYKMLRQLLVIGASSAQIKKCLQENEKCAKAAVNATKSTERALKAELKTMLQDAKVNKKAGASEEAMRDLEHRIEGTQMKISLLSLTQWLERRKLDPRASQPIGEDPLGNVYYIVPHDEELAGYASWVLCQKGPELDHPLGEDWVETEGDGGCTKAFYAIDGPEAIGILVRWIQQKSGEKKAAIEAGGLGDPTGTNCYVVLIGKLQQFAEMLRVNARQCSVTEL